MNAEPITQPTKPLCRCARWIRIHWITKDGITEKLGHTAQYRDGLANRLLTSLDGIRLQFWTAAHDLEKACRLRRLKVWIQKTCYEKPQPSIAK